MQAKRLGLLGALALVWLCACGDSAVDRRNKADGGDDADGATGEAAGGTGGRDGRDASLVGPGGDRDGGLLEDGGGAGGTSGSGGNVDAGPVGPGGCVGDECPTEDDCTGNQLWNGRFCAPCPKCDGPGEVGRWPAATADGYCICETEPGYYYSTGGEIGTFDCDVDGDGWVRESARSSLEAKDDTELFTNARCPLKTINKITLRTEGGSDRVVTVAPALRLFETDRNDDDDLLRRSWTDRGLPAYRTDGLPVSASQVNGFTKLCHAMNTDYNDNGVADVEEWEDHALPPNARVSEQSLLQRFAYFAELHTGHYVAPTSGVVGSYLIEEKSRDLAEAETLRVMFTYGPGEGDYWRQCTRKRDVAWDTLVPPVGVDYAKHYTTSAPWPGMTHHSQFKCLGVVTTLDADNPNALTKAMLQASNYRVNQCRAAGSPVEQDDAPALGKFTCTLLDPVSVMAGRAYWGLQRYEDYVDPADYERGCINSCAVPVTGCNDVFGPNKGELIPGCLHDPLDFGRKIGCAEECDNMDNDNDGTTDESTTGLPCDPSPQGGVLEAQWRVSACGVGHTTCTSGAFACPPDYSPGELAETCNDEDDDCDGMVDDAIATVGNACTPAIAEDGTTLAGACTAGTRTCALNSMTDEKELACRTNAATSAELPCDGLDNDCNGQVDETRTYFEGDPRDGTQRPDQCDDGIDNNCDGNIDANGSTEVCGNDLDDDCDSIVDEAYVNDGVKITALKCKYPCESVGKRICRNELHPGTRAIADRQADAKLSLAGGSPDAYLDDNPEAKWVAYPPYYNKFWKVMVCTGGFWEVEKVCGLGDYMLYNTTPTPSPWVTSTANTYCTEPSGAPGTAVCQASSSGVTISGVGVASPSSGCSYTPAQSCLTCWNTQSSVPSPTSNCSQP
jgi:hypothetical protein